MDPLHLRPTEQTPLLPGRRDSARSTARRRSEPERDDRPYIGTFLADIRLEDLPAYSIDTFCPPTLSASRAARAAFSLCALLYYRKSISGNTASRGRDVWIQWHEQVQHRAGVDVLDTLILRTWSTFLEEEGTPEEIGEALWAAFPIDPYSSGTVRVIDFLATGDASEEFLCHPLVHLSLIDTWKYGHPNIRDESGVVTALLQFVDRCGAPRVLYIINLLLHSVYLGMIYDYMNRPDTLKPMTHALLLVFGIAKLVPPWSISTLPPLLLVISFVSCLPHPPTPYDVFAFDGVLHAFFWEIILLHFPFQNSPLHLFRPDQVLPLALLAGRGLYGMLVPAVFFLPGLIISFYLLAVSFQDWNLWLSISSLVGRRTLAPMDTRITMFTLFCAFFVFIILSLVYSALVHPFLASFQDSKATSWDRYTKSVGLKARRTFARTVRFYGTAYYFPAPLNLIQFLIRASTRLFLSLFGNRDAVKATAVEKVAWRVVVGPVAFLTSGLWLWNLRVS